ncbi:hypothetical protein OIU84_006233 [Salix udensis]|uniref:Uncharacterized protein n=1 Tax=Salix udensis TaxID=889485 RepID=A0AAD6JZM1_9ROSI|nr:hypothetical protein OIU84_006233 [Salix udensis]
MSFGLKNLLVHQNFLQIRKIGCYAECSIKVAERLPPNPSTGSCNDDASSSSLPPLMESYITFEQTQPNSDEHEQVPCFSIFSENQNLLAPYITPMEIPNAPTMDITNPLDSVSCDTKVLKAVLNNLAKMESYASFKGSPSLGEGSSESYISGVGMSNLWSHHH